MKKIEAGSRKVDGVVSFFAELVVVYGIGGHIDGG